ncbi:hypothetical protein TorRG33x02_161350 [Trema orientale]|uniref:Uncharacterized protein n=1 Tax=Trema orientale TaxID=63057 RepID=A0A2P5ERC8_TREOI|nr:hypothetical protein TorRG33x02_161350 [Trema orientale]
MQQLLASYSALGERRLSTLKRGNVGKYLLDIKERLKCSRLSHTDLCFKEMPHGGGGRGATVEA